MLARSESGGAGQGKKEAGAMRLSTVGPELARGRDDGDRRNGLDRR